MAHSLSRKNSADVPHCRFHLTATGVCVFITAGPITKLFALGPVRRRRRIYLYSYLTQGGALFSLFGVCVFITAVPITKLFAWGVGGSGGPVLRKTTSRGYRV